MKSLKIKKAPSDFHDLSIYDISKIFESNKDIIEIKELS